MKNFFELEKSIEDGASDPKTHLDIYIENWLRGFAEYKGKALKLNKSFMIIFCN